jgi:hypothetical protein
MLLWTQAVTGVVSGFSSAGYWSSTESGTAFAVDMSFTTGRVAFQLDKNTLARVRPILAFTY